MRFKEELQNIVTYEAGKPIELVVREFGIDPKSVIKLASNENPFGTSDQVKNAVAKIADQLHRYPDDSYFELKEKLAKKYGVESKNIIIGSGSDQIFEFITHALLDKNDVVLQNKITFAMYKIYSDQVGAKTVTTTSDKHDLGEFTRLAKTHKPKLTYICTPSNPYGDALDKSEIFDYLDRCDQDSLVVIDAAYMEYASYKDSNKRVDPKELISRYKNAIYTGTFSKAYGLGGMRVGYGIADEAVIRELHKLRAPFNITTLSLRAAITALDDEDFVSKSADHNFKEMARYESFCGELGLKFIPSYTNFITILFPDDKSSTKMADQLLRNGLIIRNLASYKLNAIRVTIGLTHENDRFFELFRKIWG